MSTIAPATNVAQFSRPIAPHPNLEGRFRLDHVPDDALHAGVKKLAGRYNVLTAELLAHLAEVDARGIYRERACSSLYTYCVYELRLSEDEAQRRAKAARTAREFPALFEMLAEGAIHLTGLLLLAPYLTRENNGELLARARFRTKREIEHLVAEIAPRPDVPARIEPLGPRRVANLWQAYTASLRGAVRELEPGVKSGDAPPVGFDESEDAESMPEVGNVSEAMTGVEVDGGANGPVVEREPALATPERVAGTGDASTQERVKDGASAGSAPARAKRHVPAAIRRAVWERDRERCTFEDTDGRRCSEQAGLEIHHEHAFALGGPMTLENLRLLCRVHNGLVAERDFGRQHVERMKHTRDGTKSR